MGGCRFVESREYTERALHIFEGAFGDRHPSTAVALNNLGMLFYERYDPDAEEEEMVALPSGGTPAYS